MKTLVDTVIRNDTVFTSGSGNPHKLEDVVVEIKKYMDEYPESEYRIQVGTDSMTRQNTKFVTAIIVHRVGKGARFFYKSQTVDKMHVLAERINNETALSISTGSVLVDLFLENDMLCEITIHCDVGEKGATREFIRSVVGYVTSCGFDCKIKPESVAASTVADRLSK